MLLSVAASIDGHIDDTSPQRLLLSNSADFDRVDQVRADSDAVLVGAQTVRRDNPRLVVNSEARRAARIAAGKPEYPLKITVTESGELDPELRFWHHGGDKVVYTTTAGAHRLGTSLHGLAEVMVLGTEVDLQLLLDDLGRRSVQRLMVEGGTRIHTSFLATALADELQLAVAPTLVGESAAPRLLGPADYPGGPGHRMRLVSVQQIGDIALLRYLTKETAPDPAATLCTTTDQLWMSQAVELARRCPPSDAAFSVGAVIVSDGMAIAHGYSRESHPKVHAEEAALDKLDTDDSRLRSATVYSTLEPCTQRATANRLPCAQRLLGAGVSRVVIAWREPATFVTNCTGVEQLRGHGVEVVELPEMAQAAMSMNRHLELS